MSSSSSSLGDTAAAVVATTATATAAAAAPPADNQPIGKKRRTEEGVAAADTSCSSTTEKPPAVLSSNTVDSGGSSSSKHPRTTTEDDSGDDNVVLEERCWLEVEDDFLLNSAAAADAGNAKKKWKDVAKAINQEFKLTKEITWSDCWSRHGVVLKENEINTLKNELCMKDNENNTLKNENNTLKNENNTLKNELCMKDNKINKLENKNKKISLQSLFSVRAGQFKLVKTGSDSSHVNGNHAAAKAAEADFPLDIPSNEQLEQLKSGDSDSDCPPSMLLLEFAAHAETENNEQPLEQQQQQQQQQLQQQLPFKDYPYATEADIAYLVTIAVKDSISILQKLDMNKYKKLSTRLERSLFSYRPDILIVRFNNNPICAVEVKKPVPTNAKNNGLASFHAVLGQAFDYIKLLEALGQKKPLVVITSFEESFACWTKKEEESQAANTQILPTTTSMQCQSSSTTQHSNSNLESSSPPDSHICITPNATFSESPPELRAPSNIISSDSMVSSTFESSLDRKMSRSKVLGSHELVRLLCSSISFAVKNDIQRPKFINDLVHGRKYQFGNVLRVTESLNKYTWGRLENMQLGIAIESTNVLGPRGASHAQIVQQKKEDDTSYYIIGRLGYGNTSNVYHALDSSGTQVALKVYVKATDGNDKWLSSVEFKNEAEKKTNDEKKRLLLFYPFLEGKVKVVTLFDGFQCIVMPFFKPVEKEKRSDTLNAIKVTLRKRFFENSWKYSSEDVRWRHVGFYQGTASGDQQHCILYDLADLEELKEDDDDHESLVQKHIRILESRSQTEAEMTPDMFARKQEKQT